MVLGPNVPLAHQPENYLITDIEWIQQYNIDVSEIRLYLDSPDTLWGDGYAVDAAMVKSGLLSIEQSLYLIEVLGLTLYKNEANKRRVAFSYNGKKYDFPVTDPNFDALLSGQIEHHGYICVSLGEEYNGRHYKIAATII